MLRSRGKVAPLLAQFTCRATATRVPWSSLMSPRLDVSVPDASVTFFKLLPVATVSPVLAELSMLWPVSPAVIIWLLVDAVGKLVLLGPASDKLGFGAMPTSIP